MLDMPSKRKSRRTHIFQRTTRASRARVKKASKGNHVQSEETEAHDESVDENLHQDRQVDEQIDENEENSVNTECELEKEVDSNILDTADVQDGPEKHGKKITETNIENKNKSNSETPVLVYRHKRISRRSHHYKSYSHEMLVAAYKCVKELKMPVKTAARVFGVPSSTLHNRVQGQVQIDDSIISLEDIHKIVNRLKKGDPLEDVFADLNYERAHGHAVNADHTAEKEDSSNDDSITESILKKMNSDIKEEVMDPEYECQMNESESSTSDLNSIVDTDNSELASAERMKRAYKRNYKTYSYEQLVAAYLYVKEKKVAVKFAARAFGVPPSTLNDRVQGKVFIDTSIVMNNPKGRKILPQPQFNKHKTNSQDSYQSENVTSSDSAPSEVSASDFNNISQVPRVQAYDAVEHTPEFQNIFKKHKCRDQYRKYTPEQLMEACKYSIETKASYREVSEKFGVPQSTLRDKLHAVEKLNADAGCPAAKKPRQDVPDDTSQESPTVASPQPPEINSDEKMIDQRSNYRQYSKDSLTTAAHYVAKFNTPIMKAARMFGVPASTLKDHVKNKLTFDMTEPISQGSIPSLINERDEKKLIEYIKMMEKCGFILTMREIIEFGSELASASQEIEGSITLSDSWYHDFVKRWPPIGLVNREGRSPVPHDIKRYFLELNKVFNKHKFFERPELVYVIDEVDITLQYNPLKLVPGKKLHRKNSRSSQPLLTSVVGCCNALGTSVPPYYVLQSDEILTDVIGQSPPGTQASFANSISKESTVLKDYFQNHFIRFAQSGRNTQNRFVLVFYDSRKTNLNVSDIEWAKRWHILLFPLPHPITPDNDPDNELIDGIFQNYSDDVEFQRSLFVKEKGFMAVAMPDICGILGKAYRKSLSYSHIVTCFENWGIYPLHPQNYVDKLDISFQLKLQDLRALPNYDTNLWLLSDFSCTQAVNNAIESSFNESNSICSNRHGVLSSQLSRQNSGSEASYDNQEDLFNASYQGMLNHLIGQAVQNHQTDNIVNGVAIKTEPVQEGYGVMCMGNISAVESSTEGLNNQVVPQMKIVQTFSEAFDPVIEQENKTDGTNDGTGQAKNKCESSSSSRRKGKCYRVIVNEPDPEIEGDESASETQLISTKSKPDASKKPGRLGSLLDEKVRKLHQQAKASCETEDNDEPLMQVGEFQIVMNKGD